jgi:hypothetical protein
MYVCTVRVRTMKMERCASAARVRAGFTEAAHDSPVMNPIHNRDRDGRNAFAQGYQGFTYVYAPTTTTK